jgi:hypothetical protein
MNSLPLSALIVSVSPTHLHDEVQRCRDIIAL